MPRVQIRAAARRDLLEQFEWLAENASIETADHFMAQAETTFEYLATEPRIGAPIALRSRHLADLRKWRVRGFDNHLIFYLPRPDGISVVRVLHAARDWWGLLDIDG